ncbi:hypothetical protein B484DRAFT_278757 [Ochromonadaceae sp. CCMP2298]|nr:hypothetical protein B484DRAFT_278757 [Ochromonadaceae sp. CCMP2298]
MISDGIESRRGASISHLPPPPSDRGGVRGRKDSLGPIPYLPYPEGGGGMILMR